MIEQEKGYFIQVSTRKNKKYDIYTKQNDKYKYLLSFGQLPYQHWRDSTKLKYYSNLNHGDDMRKKRYFARHGLSNDKNSAKYWANKYLW